MSKVVCFGETMIRFTTEPGVPLEGADNLQLHVAGAESNVAVTLSWLGITAHWLSVLPDNALGRFIASQLRRHGVHLDHVTWTSSGRVGLYFTDIGSQPRGTDVVYDRSGSAFALAAPDDIDWSVLDGADLLHLSGITPALKPNGTGLFERALHEARLRSVRLSVDINHRAYLWSIDEAGAYLSRVLRDLEFLFVSWRDVGVLIVEDSLSSQPRSGESVLEVARNVAAQVDARQIVITTGNQGAGCLMGGHWEEVPACEVEILDPIGRGDAFVGGFLYESLGGARIRQALRSGSAAAAIAQTYRGDISWMTKEQLQRVLSGEEVPVRR